MIFQKSINYQPTKKQYLLLTKKPEETKFVEDLGLPGTQLTGSTHICSLTGRKYILLEPAEK